MNQKDKPGRPHYRVLSIKTIWAGVLIMSILAASSVWLLLEFAGDPKDGNRLEIIKTAGTILVGTGGAVALLLAARRQRFVELDGTERRITDLQTKAADQLGSDQAAVRLAGLYALERLAQDNPSHRQTIVDIVCGYLRMPYTPPSRSSATPRNGASLRPHRPAWMRPQSAKSGISTDRDRRQEQQVRLTAQRILAAHLRPNPGGLRRRPGNPKYWPHVDLDLSGATLMDFSLEVCHIRTGTFNGAHFTGNTWFGATTFSGNAYFKAATFTGTVSFDAVTFTDHAWFIEAAFIGEAWFSAATFIANAFFGKAAFTGEAVFRDAAFAGNAMFQEAVFEKGVNLRDARASDSSGADFSVWPKGWMWGDRTNKLKWLLKGAKKGAWHSLVPAESIEHPQNPASPTVQTTDG